MTSPILRRITSSELPAQQRDPIDTEALTVAQRIDAKLCAEGGAALRACAERFDNLPKDAPLILERATLRAALDAMPKADRALLDRAAQRIERFAIAQRNCLAPLDIPIDGGRAGHTLEPIDRVGCYIPGGRFPLPSSALMTIIPARIAGASSIIAASPRPTPATLAAAALAGADALLPIGGAHAISALSLGIPGFDPRDIIVGPGNRFVTAAKHIVSRRCAIDMLAGPSELLIIADDTADPRLVAADLLAQAEHDPDARPILITTSAALADAVDAQLALQLESLPTADTARASLATSGICVLVTDLDEACRAADALAPEHLEILTRAPDALAARLGHAGALFIGPASAEVLGDYAAGPNHTLPTGASARSRAGLSVLTFLRARTWLRITDPAASADLTADCAAFARLEGLEAHARAALLRAP